MSGKLAILGGEKAIHNTYPAWPVHDEREVEAVAEVIRSGNWGGYHGIGGSGGGSWPGLGGILGFAGGPAGGGGGGGALLLFSILRNLPWSQFAWLGLHA